MEMGVEMRDGDERWRWRLGMEVKVRDGDWRWR